MARPRLRFLSVLLFSAAAALCARLYFPATTIDQALVGITARSYANPPFIISGNGTRAQPWSLKVLAPYHKGDAAQAPVVISLGDDPEGIFQTSPPSPIDLAIILKNMRRLGASKVAISAILAWEKPDVIALAALDTEMAKFPALVSAAPLSRAATSAALPPTFRNASLPLDRVLGDVSTLPVVNRVSLPGVILGGDAALSGFSILENEDADQTPLIARWDDRVVFSFQLLAALAQRGLPVDGVRIDLGNFIELSAAGPVIPIDSFGRLMASSGKLVASKPIPADSVIDRQTPLPIAETSLALLRDDQSTAEATTRDFSRKVAPLIASISSGAGMSSEIIFRRPSEKWEIGMLATLAFLLAALANRSRFVFGIGLLVLATLIISVHFIAASTTACWLPTLPALLAVLTAFVITLFFTKRVPDVQKILVPESSSQDSPKDPEISIVKPVSEPEKKTPLPTKKARGKSRGKRKSPPPQS